MTRMVSWVTKWDVWEIPTHYSRVHLTGDGVTTLCGRIIPPRHKHAIPTDPKPCTACQKSSRSIRTWESRDE